MQAVRPSDGQFPYERLIHRWRHSIALLALAVALTSCSDEQAGSAAPAAPVANAPAVVEAPVPADLEPAVSMPENVADDEVAEATGTEEPAPPAAAASARAPQQFEVLGVVTQWSPMVLFVQPGDSVVFKQMTGHDTETVEGMVPEDGVTWKSALGQEGFSVTLDVPGAYVYKCNPHVSTGMIGVIVVGDPPPANLAQIKASPLNKGMIGRAVRKLDEALAAH